MRIVSDFLSWCGNHFSLFIYLPALLSTLLNPPNQPVALKIRFLNSFHRNQNTSALEIASSGQNFESYLPQIYPILPFYALSDSKTNPPSISPKPVLFLPHLRKNVSCSFALPASMSCITIAFSLLSRRVNIICIFTDP